MIKNKFLFSPAGKIKDTELNQINSDLVEFINLCKKLDHLKDIKNTFTNSKYL